jgi:saccharopine dehydrogenase-like NADP-dependent oxidoreductase
MKQILVLGAGQSAPYMIKYLLDNAPEHDWFVTVGDLSVEQAEKAIDNHPRGAAIRFDVNDANLRSAQIAKSDVVVNFLAPVFQHLIAVECLANGKHMVTASYQDPLVDEMNADALRKGILFLNELGLDPGIDLMSAMDIIDRIRSRNGRVIEFVSYGSGIPAPDDIRNPLGYYITWNPRNVVMAGDAGAQYLENGKIKILSHCHVFQRTWPVDVEGVGLLEAYPNRDSLRYLKVFELNHIETMVRGTLRYPGWSETWNQIVRLGIPNETMKIPNVNDMTYRDFVEMFMPINMAGTKLEQRVANFLGISPTGKIMANLKWLGLFSDEKIDTTGNTAAEVMVSLLRKKLALPADGKDMVAIVHEIVAEYPDENNRREHTTSTFVEYGDPGKFTAIAKSVGLPAAIATKLLLTDQIPLSGCHIPTHPAIYKPVLAELEKAGFHFSEKTVEVVR